jgi:leader peptidase (prepilin peptidase)/N-methyltransferase
LGCSIGSFLNVLIERLPREESVVKGRSHCDSCQYMLAWYDLFPLFSYIFLNGTCRYCHKKIGSQTFIIEAFTGILFAVTGYSLFTHMTSPLFFLLSLVYVLFIFCCFIAIAVIDTKHGIIPNTLVYSGLLLSLIYHIFSVQTFLSYLFSALGAGGFFFFLFAVTKGRGMGFGDVKLALLLGLFLGFPNIVIALYVAFLTGAVIAFILVLEKKKKFSGSTIPFGPFLILGAFIAFFYGDFLWNHILSSFL